MTKWLMRLPAQLRTDQAPRERGDVLVGPTVDAVRETLNPHAGTVVSVLRARPVPTREARAVIRGHKHGHVPFASQWRQALHLKRQKKRRQVLKDRAPGIYALSAARPDGNRRGGAWPVAATLSSGLRDLRHQSSGSRLLRSALSSVHRPRHRDRAAACSARRHLPRSGRAPAPALGRVRATAHGASRGRRALPQPPVGWTHDRCGGTLGPSTGGRSRRLTDPRLTEIPKRFRMPPSPLHHVDLSPDCLPGVDTAAISSERGFPRGRTGRGCVE